MKWLPIFSTLYFTAKTLPTDPPTFEGFKLAELKPDTKTFIDSKANIEIFMIWEDWGCCSACCCPEYACGKFASEKNCDRVESFRSRHGEIVVRQKDLTKPIATRDLSKMLQNGNNISLTDFKTFTNDFNRASVKVNEFLSYYGLKDTDKNIFQVENCAKLEQKLDCWKWAECHYGNSLILPEKKLKELTDVDVCENVTIYVLRESYSIFLLDPERIYRLQVDATIGEGNLNYVNFSMNGNRIDPIENVDQCDGQGKRMFQHPQSGDLIVRLSRDQLDKNPKVFVNVSFRNVDRLILQADLVSSVDKEISNRATVDFVVSLSICGVLALASLVLLKIIIMKVKAI